MLIEWFHALVWLQRHRRGQLAVPELPLIRPMVREDDVLLDVGAHAGSWALPMARWVPNGEVLAFEALPYYATTLRHLIKLARCSNVNVVNAAVTATPSTVKMIWRDSTGRRLTGLTHIAQEGENLTRGTVSVQGIRLDDHLARESRRVRFLKCDVEGSELNVFLGAEQIIAKWRPIVFTELVAKHLARYNHSPADVFAFFQRHHYVAWETSGPTTARRIESAMDYLGHDLLLMPVEETMS